MCRSSVSVPVHVVDVAVCRVVAIHSKISESSAAPDPQVSETFRSHGFVDQQRSSVTEDNTDDEPLALICIQY